MADIVSQDTPNPTRKLAAASLAAAFMSVSGLVIKNVAPTWYDPEVWATLLPIVVFALGYIVKDRDNSGLSPLAKEVGQTVDAELPAGEPVILRTPENIPDIVVGVKS